MFVGILRKALFTSVLAAAACDGAMAPETEFAGRTQALTTAAALFRNTSTMRDNAPDWDSCRGKASCAPGETISGISELPWGTGRTGLCKQVGTATYSGNAVATLALDPGGDSRRALRLGDWASGYYKLECGLGEYVSGVSENAMVCQANYRFHAIRCATGTGLGSSCSTRVFDSTDDRGTTTSGDWDVGAHKGECAENEYVAGVSVSPSSGRPHSLLCCQQAAVGCTAGQTLLDGTTCVTLTPWQNQTAVPAGSKLAIRLRKANVHYTYGLVDWPKWVGLSDSDNTTLDAVDTELKSRDLFTVTTFWPTGESSWNFPWYNMLAANGMYVGGMDGTSELSASRSQNDAGMFARGWDAASASQLLLQPYTWGARQTWLDGIHQGANAFYSVCQSPFTLGTNHIEVFVSGSAPNYGCSASGYVDYFLVTQN